MCNILLERLTSDSTAMTDGHVQPEGPFNIRGSHSIAWAAELPSWLPDPTIEYMLDRFSKQLCLELEPLCGLELLGDAANTNTGQRPTAQRHQNTPSTSSISSVVSTTPSVFSMMSDVTNTASEYSPDGEANQKFTRGVQNL